jgi:arylsulfatase A-like enzyme
LSSGPARRRLAPGLLALAALSTGACDSQPLRRNNLVLVSVDTVPRDALASLGETTPTLERLAATSLRFENAYSTASWTLPAHASLLSGLYPDRHGAVDTRTPLAADRPRLARALREAGFETVAFTDGELLDHRFGFAEGFDRYDLEPHPNLVLPRGGLPPAARSAKLFDRAIAYLNAREPADPEFFLFLHTYAVHDYFRDRGAASRKVPPAEPSAPETALDCLLGRTTCPPESWRALAGRYRAELVNLDRGLSRLLVALERSGAGEHTFLVLLSDHGEGFDVARGRIHHGGRLHADQLRIPFWIGGPGITSGTRAQAASLTDVMPTALDLLGVAIPDGLDGRSLLPAIRDELARDARVVYAMEHYYDWAEGRRRAATEVQRAPLSIAVIRDRDWYIRGTGGEELYDVASDPSQTRDLAQGSPKLAELRGLAEQRGRTRATPPARPLDPVLRERLRALGYVD